MKISRTLETIAAIPWIQEHEIGISPDEKARRALLVKGVDLRTPTKPEPLHRSPSEFIRP